MKIHNQMEDLVLKMVDDIFNEQEKLKVDNICTCSQCRMDIACYVLNRVSPQYIISGRGAAHLDADYLDLQQKKADLVSLIHEGVKKVAKTKRPFFNHDKGPNQDEPKGPLFNFPIISGKVFNGNTFQPEAGLSVHLVMEGKPVRMINPNWPNPYDIVDNTAGSFLFWPFPIKSDIVGDKKSFNLELILEKPGFETVRRFVTLELSAAADFYDSFQLENSIKIEDTYIFPPSEEEERT